jgi:Family of unknown function (DUF6099)
MDPRPGCLGRRGDKAVDATRLIAETRQALRRASDARAVVVEAWQAHALVEAVGGKLAADGRLGPLVGPSRAARLTGVREPAAALRELLATLTDAVATLVEWARSTEEVLLYWQCVEAGDATSDAADQVRRILERYEALAEPP